MRMHENEQDVEGKLLAYQQGLNPIKWDFSRGPLAKALVGRPADDNGLETRGIIQLR